MNDISNINNLDEELLQVWLLEGRGGEELRLAAGLTHGQYLPLSVPMIMIMTLGQCQDVTAEPNNRF